MKLEAKHTRPFVEGTAYTLYKRGMCGVLRDFQGLE